MDRRSYSKQHVHLNLNFCYCSTVMHEDVCDVKIYIIAEVNLVTFMFLNTKVFVDQQRERVSVRRSTLLLKL